MRLFIVSLLSGLLLGACSSEPSLTIQIATGLVPGPEFTQITTELIENNAPLDTALTLQTQRTVAAFGQQFARGRRVSTFERVGEGQHTVRVRLYRPDGTLLIQHRTRVDVHGDYILTMHLTRDCVNVTCPSPGGSPAFSECLAGRCVDTECIASDPTSCAGVTFCNSSSECGTVSACAEQNCFEGVCEPQARENACEPTEWCDPDVGQGCLPALLIDAGIEEDASIVDEGVSDSAVDAISGCGRTCAPEGDPCGAGFLDCTGPSPACVRLGRRSAGTLCAEGSVCDETGACVACRAGADCHIGCATGHVDCSRGTEECVLDEPAASSPAGTTCETGLACVDADTCGSGKICDAAASCVPCSDGAACILGCDVGAISCSSGGDCVSTGTHRPPGSSCGTDMRCTVDGACVPCVAGASCASEDVCEISTIDCSAGTPACVVTSGLGPGASCGENLYCDYSNHCQLCEVFGSCVSNTGCGFGYYDSCDFGPSCAILGTSDPGTTCPGGVCGGSGECYPPLVASYIGVSDQFGCALLPGGTVSCWGDSSYGELGRGVFDSFNPSLLYKQDVGLTNVSKLSVGSYSACAVTTAGALWCWGGNDYGGLGLGSTEASSFPLPAATPVPVSSVAVGSAHVCAILTDGRVFCSGLDALIGTGDATSHVTFTEVPGVTGAMQLATGGMSTCARLTTGAIQCWGLNESGELGNGMIISDPPFTTYDAVDVLGISDAIDVSVGGSTACAILTGGELWCWGQANPTLFLDAGAATTEPTPRHVVLPFSDITDVEVGASRICVLRGSGEMYCWGDNSSGQNGVGSYGTLTEPTPVLYLTDIVQQSITFGSSSCVRRAGGEVHCFGDNSFGQLGDGTYTGWPYRVPARSY